LRLDFNENTIGCSPRVLDCLRSLNLEQLARYPERAPVEAKVADFLGVAASELLLTNGVDEAIHLLCQTYLDPRDEALIVVPTYSMYRIYALAAGVRVVSVPLGEEFQFCTNAVCDRITDRTRLIAIANPNNPTGTVATPQHLLRIATSAPQAALLVDEAYFEFYDQTMLGAHRDIPNIFVARTFSKAYGMAGLRAGVLVGNAEQIPSIRRVSSPYNVNAAALACLPEAIADQTYIQRYVNEVLEARSLLERTLRTNGIHFWPSQANFVLARIGSSAADSAAFAQQMRARGILVRDRSADPSCEGCVRITLGPKAHTAKLLQALQETLHELRLLQGASRS
jgi:histidinol-phosphate aminotransferase